MPVHLPAIVTDVEQRLAAFYGFSPKSSAIEHLVSRTQLQASLGDRVTELPEYAGRAGVYLLGGNDDLYIGIHFDESVTEPLEEASPLGRLDARNLDEFCVVVEEVSHFHLILNRAEIGRGVSKLELEWQGEIDKLLVCAFLLEAQCGEAHLMPLARRLYDEALITSADRELYWQATRHAARFWFDAMRDHTRVGPELRDWLRRSYDASWSDKVAQLATVRMRRAS